MDFTNEDLSALSEPQGQPYQSFMDLNVWKEARVFKLMIRDLAQTFPATEKFRLADQIIRSSRSVNANIAEGHGRRTFKDQHHFCIQARGSHSETLNHLHDAMDEELLDRQTFDQLAGQYKKVEALLNSYISYLRKHFN